MSQRAKKFGVVTVLLLIVGGTYLMALKIAQFGSEMESTANCIDNGVEAWQMLLREYAESHGGRLPSAADRSKIGAEASSRSSHFFLKCKRDVPYVWDDKITRVESKSPRLLAWCSKPHGFSRRWRNVLFSDLVVREVPEAEAERF